MPNEWMSWCIRADRVGSQSLMPLHALRKGTQKLKEYPLCNVLLTTCLIKDETTFIRNIHLLACWPLSVFFSVFCFFSEQTIFLLENSSLIWTTTETWNYTKSNYTSASEQRLLNSEWLLLYKEQVQLWALWSLDSFQDKADSLGHMASNLCSIVTLAMRAIFFSFPCDLWHDINDNPTFPSMISLTS